MSNSNSNESPIESNVVQTGSNGSLIAILVMMFLYAMISFVTNLAAPIGLIWKGSVGGSVGMLGNFMNFLAYLFMGIPAGKLLMKVGYKKTTLIGVALGFVGVFTQFMSGHVDSVGAGFAIYLAGAFISGFCVCILNTVVNPMLKLLGGGGNRGNQLNLVGGTLNSLSGTLTPLFVGSLIGVVTANTSMVDVFPVLYIAMGVFAFSFVALLFIPIEDPQKTGDSVKLEHSPWEFRHFVLGTIAIFVYVGVEVGLPGILTYYLADTTEKGAGLLGDAAAIAGSVAATYWFMMLCGRMIGSVVASKVSPRALMIGATGVSAVLIVAAMCLGNSSTVSMPVFTGSSFGMVSVPICALLIVLCGLCTSVMWSSIFSLATEGLGKYTSVASGIFMMMVVGGGVLPYLQEYMANQTSYLFSYVIPLLAVIYMFYYGVVGCKNVNTDIPVDE